MAVVGDLNDRLQGITDLVIDNGVHTDGDRVFGEHLLWGHVQGHGSQVDLAVVIDAWQDKEDTWTTSSRSGGDPCGR